MAKTKIAPGQVIETVTPSELRTHLDSYTAHWFQEKARGVTTFRFDAADTVAATNVTVPALGEQPIGPQPGFVWFVAAVRADGLSTGDSLKVYRNAAIPKNYVCTITAAAPFVALSSKSVTLKGDERLNFTGTGLTATGDITVNGEGFECAETDLSKLV